MAFSITGRGGGNCTSSIKVADTARVQKLTIAKLAKQNI
jgi:hypothetical protein